MLSDLRRLRNFLLIVEAQSLAVAALRANLTQPALSKQVAALEAELGQRLLERHARGVRLTEAGTALRDRAAGLLRDAERVAAEVGAAAADVRGEVAVGTVSSLRGFLLAPAAASFLRAHPATRVRLLEGTSRAMREALTDGRADLALIATREGAAPLELQDLATEPMLAVGPPDARLRLDVPLALAELRGRPLILTAAPNSIRTVLDAALLRAGTSAPVRAEVENVATAIDLVRLGVGWSVFPYSAIARALAERDISAAPLGRLAIGWSFATARERRVSAVARAFGEAIWRTARDLSARGSWPGAVLVAPRTK